MSEMFEDGMGMAATGVGLGILTVGGLVALTMQNMVNEPQKKKKAKKKAKKTTMPKITMPKLQF